MLLPALVPRRAFRCPRSGPLVTVGASSTIATPFFSNVHLLMLYFVAVAIDTRHAPCRGLSRFLCVLVGDGDVELLSISHE